ncbi:unnamed protein product [Victoria cruziana]
MVACNIQTLFCERPEVQDIDAPKAHICQMSQHRSQQEKLSPLGIIKIQKHFEWHSPPVRFDPFKYHLAVVQVFEIFLFPLSWELCCKCWYQMTKRI